MSAPTATTTPPAADILLVGGLWLGPEAWDAVLPSLAQAGHRPPAVTLPGASRAAADRDATLDDQVDAVVTAIDGAAGPVVVVGHSAACTLAWLAADRRPDKVARVVLIGGMPSGEGEQYAAFFPRENGVMPFPGWEPFAGPDSADLDDATKQRIEQTAIPVAAAVAEGRVSYRNDARRIVPVTMVCPEYTPEQARQWLEAGDIPELEGVALDYVDLDSGHWPMFSAPELLARELASVADRA